MDKRRRRGMIRELVEKDPPRSQEELVERLADMGIDTNQSTVSRDLRDMGVVRLPNGEEGSFYGFPGEQAGPLGESDLGRGLRSFLVAAEAGGNLVVVRTEPGNAHALAVILDRSDLAEVAGTVAGDDTILVVVREGFDARGLANRLEEM
ncbi:MAG: arginine repressor [Actinomycetota bacterium]|nr:arginine repressor [Actinomycetota bacterium]